MIRVSTRAHRYEDRAGDPLDGLVNMFDIGIVLSVAFLLAALSSLHLTSSITRRGLQRPSDVVTAPPGATVSTVPPSGARTVGRGSRVGVVYRLDDGRLVYVLPPSAGPAPTPAPTP